jgi:hypothetical protein
LPANVESPAGANDLLQPLDELYACPPDVSTLRDRVLSQLATNNYEL